MNRPLKALALSTLVLALGACDSWNNDRGIGDADVGEQDTSPAFIIVMPDGFMNVAVKCYGPNGIYAHTREAAPVIVKDDANCATVADGEISLPGGG